MTLPAFAAVPSSSAIQLPPEEWQACIDSWIALAELNLRLSDEDWSKSLEDGSSNVARFLRSYFVALAYENKSARLTGSSSSETLRRLCFLLNHRALSTDAVPSTLLDWRYLQAVATVFPRNEELKKLLSSLWRRKSDSITPSLQSTKTSLIKQLDEKDLGGARSVFVQAVPLLHQLPDVAAYMLTGSDLLDSIGANYLNTETDFQKAATLFTYLGFLGLLTCHQPNIAALSDHIYGLKPTTMDAQKGLLPDLATSTPLIEKIQDITKSQDAGRIQSLQALLANYRREGQNQRKQLVRRKLNKGKVKADGPIEHSVMHEMHIHRMSLVTQVQDLFPDLGAGFVVRLLDFYGDNVEQVTAHLLDESLPPQLAQLDQTENLTIAQHNASHDHASALEPRSTPHGRRNVYDNDELDMLAADASRLHLGRANQDLTADEVLADRSKAPNKAAILSALAAFDSDDDERDDTYDVEDVGGTVDTSMGKEEADIDKNEEVLFQAYQLSRENFSRDAATRRSKPRLALRQETGMTDEAIEGWAVMLARDPRKFRRLEARYATFTGQQNTLESTAWRGANEDGESSGGEVLSGRGRGRGRGHGFRNPRGGGRGGSVAGAANDTGTQQARQRKEASKGSRANHNRRDQRARKVARAGFPG